MSGNHKPSSSDYVQIQTGKSWEQSVDDVNFALKRIWARLNRAEGRQDSPSIYSDMFMTGNHIYKGPLPQINPLVDEFITRGFADGAYTGVKKVGTTTVTGGAVGPPGANAIPILLPNKVTDINLAPTSSVTTLVTVPGTAFAAAPCYLRNEGTAGNWLIAFGGKIPNSSSYSVKIGPGDATLVTMGEAYKEANTPIGTIQAFHDNPAAGGAGNLTGFSAWNDGTSPLAGATGPSGTNGLNGGAITMDYLFDSGTTNSDPGSGRFRLNNATETSATALYVDVTSNDGVGLATVLDNLTNSTNTNKALLRIYKRSDITSFLLFYITSETTHSNYREYAITEVAGSSASAFANGDECLLCVDQIGDAGATSPWILSFNEAGTSLANWTQTAGSWSVVSSAFHVSPALNTNAILRFTASQAQSAIVFQADVQMSTGSFGGADANRVGVMIGYDGVNGSSNAAFFALADATGGLNPAANGKIYSEQPNAQVAGPQFAFLFNLATYYTLRVVAIGNLADIFVNGTYQATYYRVQYPSGNAPAAFPRYVALQVRNCVGDFKNIKAYTVGLP